MRDELNIATQSSRKRGRIRKRKPVLGMLPRVVLLGAVLALLIVSCVAVCAKLGQPFAMRTTQARQIAGLSKQLNETRTENTLLDMRRVSLDQPEGIEVAARDQGYLRKGEERLVLETDTTPISNSQNDDSFLNKWHSAWLSIAGH